MKQGPPTGMPAMRTADASTKIEDNKPPATPNTPPRLEGIVNRTGVAVEGTRDLDMQGLNRHPRTNRTLDSLNNVDRAPSGPPILVIHGRYRGTNFGPSPRGQKGDRHLPVPAGTPQTSVRSRGRYYERVAPGGGALFFPIPWPHTSAPRGPITKRDGRLTRSVGDETGGQAE